MNNNIKFNSLTCLFVIMFAFCSKLGGNDVVKPQIGSVSIDEWMNKFDEGSPRNRSRAALALGLLGDQATEAVPLLVRALNDPDVNARFDALSALSMLDHPDEGVIDALVAKLGDDSLNVTNYMSPAPVLVVTLAQHGEAAAPALARALRNKDESVRFGAADVLRRIGPAAAAAVPALIESVSDPYDLAQRAAIEALGKVGAAARPAVPALRSIWVEQDLLTPDGLATNPLVQAIGAALASIGADPPPDLARELSAAEASRRFAALGLLAGFGPRAKPHAALVERLLSDPDEAVRESAAVAISRIDPPGRAAVARLVAALTDGDPSRRREAASTLGAMGCVAGDAVPALVLRLQDEDSDVRLEAALAVADIAPTNQPAANALAGMVRRRKDDPHAFGRIKRALASFGNLAEAALPDLADALKEMPFDRVETLAVITRINPAGDRSASALSGALRTAGEDVQLRRDVIAVLADFGPNAEPAVPALVEALGDRDPQVRRGAATALGRIGPHARAATTPLIAALRDGKFEVVSAAAQALSRVAPGERRAGEAVARAALDVGDREGVTFFVALCRLDPASRPGVAKRAEASKDLDFRACVLGVLGQETPEGLGFTRLALRELDPARHSGERSVHQMVLTLHGLENLGASARPAVPLVTALQDDPDPRVRLAATAALPFITGRVP